MAASEALYTAFAPIPQSRDDDEEYDSGPQSTAGKLLESMRQQLLKGPHNPIDVTALSAIIDAAIHGDEIDDRKLLVGSLSYRTVTGLHGCHAQNSSKRRYTLCPTFQTGKSVNLSKIRS